MPAAVQRRQVGSPTGDLSDAFDAAAFRDREVPLTAYRGASVVVIDLQGKLLSPASLYELVVPLGRAVRSGELGDLRVVVASADESTRTMIALLAEHYELPLFVATSTDAAAVDEAEPVGKLTPTERETLDVTARLGGHVTAAKLATATGLVATAAANRLVNLERKRYLYRLQRGGRQGDLFVDPRARRRTADPEQLAKGAALRAAGITFDPYDPDAIVLQGAAADAAVEIIERRRTPDA